MRIAAHGSRRVRDLHLPQHLAGPVVRRVLVDAQQLEDLGDLRADADRGVQGAAGVLVDHRERRGPQAAHLRLAHAQEVGAVGVDRAADTTRPFRGR